jgi:hypothetical protein
MSFPLLAGRIRAGLENIAYGEVTVLRASE